MNQDCSYHIVVVLWSAWP